MISSFLYPFVFSLFPVLSLYLKNISETRFADVFMVLLIVLFFTSAIYIGSYIATGNSAKTSLITFLFLFFIFSFRAFFSPFQQSLRFEVLLDIYPKFILFWIFLFFLFITLALFANKKINIVNKFLAFFSFFLVLSTVFRLVFLRPWLNTNVLSESNEVDVTTLPHNGSKSAVLPDIYYIIMDRYLGNNILQERYGFDNSLFLNFLKSKGFYVVENSRSNYLKTAHSLASSLNMEYVNYLSGEVGEDSSSWLPLYKLIEENKIARILKSKGYEYIYLGSWWEPTRKSSFADINVNLNVMSEFSNNLIKNTIFYPFYNQLFFKSMLSEQIDRSLYQIEYIKKVPLEENPTYTFAHFLITHPPYVFNEDGSLLSGSDLEEMTEEEAYITQIKYTNKLLEELVSEILSKSETKPIIVIQADEGKYPVDSIQYDYKYDWFKASPEKVEEKLSILNAIYLPDVETEVFYSTITPVNTFRIIFNEIFNMDLEILPDEIYLNQNNLNLYKFKKID